MGKNHTWRPNEIDRLLLKRLSNEMGVSESDVIRTAIRLLCRERYPQLWAYLAQMFGWGR